MAALALAVRQQTPEWREERRHHLGSSDAPILAGERGSLLALWAEKRGLVEPEFDDQTEDLMAIGQALEPALRRLYTVHTGRPVRQVHRLLTAREWPVASASLDGESGRRIVETKWTHSAEWFRALADGSADPVPGRVMAQVQWQLYVTGWDVADVAALIGREFHVIEVGRDDRYIDNLLYVARWFWPFVESGAEPDLDGSDETTRTLVRLHPRDDGSWLPADPELVALVATWRAAKVATKAAEDTEATLGTTLRSVIGTASGITGLVSWKKHADSRRVGWEQVAAGYRTVLRDTFHADPEQLNAIESLYTHMSEGPRVLRSLGGGKA